MARRIVREQKTYWSGRIFSWAVAAPEFFGPLSLSNFIVGSDQATFRRAASLICQQERLTTMGIRANFSAVSADLTLEVRLLRNFKPTPFGVLVALKTGQDAFVRRCVRAYVDLRPEDRVAWRFTRTAGSGSTFVDLELGLTSLVKRIA